MGRHGCLATSLATAVLAGAVAGPGPVEASGTAGLFSPVEQPAAAGAPAEVGQPARSHTPYVAGMIGSSFAAHESAGVGGTLLTGEGALGVAVPRPLGAVRVEVEGRQRAALSGTRPRSADAGGPSAVEIDGEWTTMANLWRDLAVTDHLSFYAGGGLGVGGYVHDADATGPQAESRVTTFGWQAGGGAAYAITDRLTIDVGGRLYGLGVGGGDLAAGPPAAEMLFAVRIADPFQGWLRR